MTISSTFPKRFIKSQVKILFTDLLMTHITSCLRRTRDNEVERIVKPCGVGG